MIRTASLALVLATLTACGEPNPTNDSETGTTGGGSTVGGGAAAAVNPLATDITSRTKDAIDRGVGFLRSRFDVAQGAWLVNGKPDAGITGLLVTALATSPRNYRIDDGPFIAKPLAYLAKLQREDGSIHDGTLANYKTSAALQALASAGGDRYGDAVKRARDYLASIQADEGEGYSEDDKFYGGAGYGGDQRPDLSNLSIWVDGMLAAGDERGSDGFKRALKFLERCQNDSEINTMRHEVDGKVYVSGDDGGAAYYPGNSKAGYDAQDDGTLVPRSYGSMTYALLKGYMAADLDANDPRVQSAMRWIANHFTLDENPGFDTSKGEAAKYQGLYYYYFTMAKALSLLGTPTVRDASGREHDWRVALATKLLAEQAEDGSWVNGRNKRWWEAMPELATGYAVQALNACYASLKKTPPAEKS